MLDPQHQAPQSASGPTEGRASLPPSTPAGLCCGSEHTFPWLLLPPSLQLGPGTTRKGCETGPVR